MELRDLAVTVSKWAESDAPPSSIALSRDDEQTAPALALALSIPRPIAVVERIEELAKLLWEDVLRPGGVVGGPTAVTCGEFFSELGFLFKYKPYGTKIATAFGYSLFDLHDGEGFSFQVHDEPKVEAFHILRTKSSSLVYISSMEEWDAGGADWASTLSAGRTGQDPPMVLRPKDGDVIAIEQTGIVHTALGCVLEEYASCSVDAVRRLHDQNARHSLVLPTAHPDVAAVYESSYSGLPARSMQRIPDGWRSDDFARSKSILEIGDELLGARYLVETGCSVALDPPDDAIALVIAVDGPIDVTIDGRTQSVQVGRFACVAPGLACDVAADRPTVFAFHRVARSLIATEWTR